MSGTRTSGLKAATTLLGRDPDYYKKIGKMGGSVKGKPKGFAANPELARLAGQKGGRNRWSKKPGPQVTLSADDITFPERKPSGFAGMLSRIFGK